MVNCNSLKLLRKNCVVSSEKLKAMTFPSKPVCKKSLQSCSE